MIRHLLVLGAESLLALGAPAAATNTTAPVVEAPAGTVAGTREGALRVFKGIPYALPPVGERRWRAPEPMPRWEGTRDATQFGATCIEPPPVQPTIYSRAAPFPQSEDCLMLNIWAPADARNAPVIFWIHGGALWAGSSRDEMYDGARLASRGVVVVTINYRLGALGWLAHPELSAESPDRVSGNYGLLDQIAALRWVHDNIAAFGGDPGNVTVAGESAGALSILCLMASPPARGLFHRAILQSGYMISTPELRRARHGAPSAEEAGARLAAQLNAPNLAALRAMDAAQLNAAAAASGFTPFGAVDGHVLPEQIVDAFNAGRQAPVPVLIGFNAGEIRSLRVLAPQVPASAAEYEATIRGRYGDLADAFLRLYPASDMAESVLATTRDALYGWTSEKVAAAQATLGQRAYLYLWDHGYPAADEANLHAFHASELPYMFGNFDATPPRWPRPASDAREQALSEAMIDYWTSFARDGRPSSAHGPAWAPYDESRAYMHFADAPRPERGLMPGMYALNEEIVCRRNAAGNIGWNWNVGLWSPPNPPATEGCGR